MERIDAIDAALARTAAVLALQPRIRELVGFGPERAAGSDAPVERLLLAFVGR
jgi:hypothetical protein